MRTRPDEGSRRAMPRAGPKVVRTDLRVRGFAAPMRQCDEENNLINNRQGGRRRGRGGQQPRGMTGNNNSGNRQDNRQRGNAAQLHEKYKSMARDAQQAGDRVQTEYFLQFADHYFRMLGDARPRFDEQKRARDDDEQYEDGEDRVESDLDNDGDGDLDGDGEEQPQRQSQPARGRVSSERGEPRRDRSNNERSNNERSNNERSGSDRFDGERPGPRRERPNGVSRADEPRDRARPGQRAENSERIDFAVLPPAIGTDSVGGDLQPLRAVEAEAADEAPRPRRRVRRPREEDDVTAS